MRVSMVMPTFNRAKYVPTAIRCFTQQTFRDVELVIVDDGTEPISIPSDGRIQYIRLDKRTSTGEKRNIAADAAAGEIIANLDDDDWSSPHRLSDQVNRLLDTGKMVTGYNTTIAYDMATGKLHKCVGGPPHYASGTSQCYWKKWWRDNPYPDVSMGEDGAFSRAALMSNQLVISNPNTMIVARTHDGNTCQRRLAKVPVLPPEEMIQEFFDAIKDPQPTLDYMWKKHECSQACANLTVPDMDLPTISGPLTGRKVLIAIESCHRDRAAQQAQRDTWLVDLATTEADYRFFLGRPSLDPAPDEVFLDVPDDYQSLAFKTQAICKWALEHGYEYVFKCDVDTLVRPKALLLSGFQSNYYSGGHNQDTIPALMDTIPFASGGAGYWMHKNVLTLVANCDTVLASKLRSAEDVFVAVCAKQQGTLPLFDPGYRWRPGETVDKDFITLHLSSALQKKYVPEMMHEYYRKMKAF